MKDKPLSLTIVGAGHYGLNLILPKYRHHPLVRVKGVISPTAAPERVARAAPDAPLSRSAAEWAAVHGRPGEADVFDLCVHPAVLVEVLESLVAIGAKNFILPKMLGSRRDKDAIEALVARHKLKAALASQLFYARLTAELAALVRKAGRRVTKVEAEFSHYFPDDKLKHYTPSNAVFPHLLQALHGTGLLAGARKAPLKLRSYSSDRIVLGRPGGKGVPELHLVSDLKRQDRTHKISVYLDKAAAPAIIADFAGVYQDGRFVEYPSLTSSGRITPVVEDLLEAMVDRLARFFLGKGGEVLTPAAYEPVFAQQLSVEYMTGQCTAVIGGGIFGLASALEVAKLGYPVVVYERNQDVMLEASMVNQCRVHMGYHYPRDIATSNMCLDSVLEFSKAFAGGTISKFDNYYALAREGSKTSREDYLAFCRKMKLPFKEQWPTAFSLAKDKFQASFKVPEPRFDTRHVGRDLKAALARHPNVSLRTGAEVTGIEAKEGWVVASRERGQERRQRFGAVINAAYSGVNAVNRLAGLPTPEYQYELCEEPVIRVPWKKRAGLCVMDGPFFGIMPFGYADEHVLYDVEISVLERSVAEVPSFSHPVSYYDQPALREERFARYVEKIRPYLPEIAGCERLYSIYTTRIVLPGHEKDDARPTVILNPAPGWWTIFSGKVVTCVSGARKLAGEVRNTLQ